MRHLMALFTLATCGCTDKTPASVQLGEIPTVTSTAQEVPLVARVLNKAGQPIAEVAPTFAIDPGDVAVITQTFGLRCLRAGDARIIASAASASTTNTVHCRLVDKLRAPKVLRLIIPNAPVPLRAQALDATGRPMNDVRPTFTVADTAIARIGEGKLVPVRVGKTALSVEAGDKKTEVAITVVRKVKSEPLLLNDGNRINQTLGQGRYFVEIKVRSGNTGFGVTAKWIGGGPDCKDSAESQHITSTCTINNEGSLVVENPTALGLGPAADGFMTIYEIPSDSDTASPEQGDGYAVPDNEP